MVTIKNAAIIIICLLNTLFCKGQSYILYGDKTFGGFKKESLSCISYIGNNQLILSGYSETNIDGDKSDQQCDSTIPSADAWILKIDTNYNIRWNTSIGGRRGEYRPFLLNERKEHFLFLSGSYSDSTCEKTENNRAFPQINEDYWLFLLDTNGNKIWDMTLGGPGGEQSTQIIKLPSGNLIVGGVSDSPVGGEKTDSNYSAIMDFWIIKLDSLGNKIWDKVYGGTGLESAPGGTPGIMFNSSLIADQDDAFILAGMTESQISGDISDSSRGGTDIWIIKVDSSGNKIWDKRYGGTKSDRFPHIIHAYDNGYILCGYTNSPNDGDVSDSTKGAGDCWVIKLDSLGNKQWDKRYGGTGDDLGSWIEKAPGGRYWISGLTKSPISFDVTENMYGIQDYWIFLIDSLGNKLWDKRFGGPGINNAPALVVMPDSSVFLGGSSQPGISPVKTDSGKGNFDFWIVHFKYTDNSVGIQQPDRSTNNISIFPNPANDSFWISYNHELNKGMVFELYNAIGQKVLSKKFDSNDNYVKINTEGIQNGIYFWKAETQHQPLQNGKIILLK